MSLEGGQMKKRVWRPLNTYGLLAIGMVVVFTISYSVISLTSTAC